MNVTASLSDLKTSVHVYFSYHAVTTFFILVFLGPGTVTVTEFV